MSKLTWDEVGKRYYETGCKKGVLYTYNAGAYEGGVVWNGLRSVEQNPSGAEATALYADDIKYLNLMSNEEFGGTIGCYTYPEEFEPCNGIKEIAPGVKVSQQDRATFGMSYVTTIGNDSEGTAHGYKIHLVYGATASPSQTSYNTINDSPEAVELSYEFTTVAVEVPGMKPTAHIEIDSRTVAPEKLTALEEILYGKDGTTPDNSDGKEPRLPLPNELVDLFKKE